MAGREEASAFRCSVEIVQAALCENSVSYFRPPKFGPSPSARNTSTARTMAGQMSIRVIAEGVKRTHVMRGVDRGTSSTVSRDAKPS